MLPVTKWACMEACARYARTGMQRRRDRLLERLATRELQRCAVVAMLRRCIAAGILQSRGRWSNAYATPP